MINVESSIVINRPIEEVFAFVADQTNAPLWQDGLIEVRRTTDGPIGVGTRHTAIRKFLGRRLELSNEYIRYVPNQEITFTGEGGPRFEVSYLTEATPEGTKLTCKMMMEPGLIFGLAEPLIARNLKHDFEVGDIQLKKLLESQPMKIQS